MKQLTYYIIITLSISLAFPAGKPCCNKKAKNTVSCKFNHTDIAKEKNISKKLTSKNEAELSTAYKNNASNKIVCAKEFGRKPWWKFWVKKTDCPCQKELDIESAGD